MKGLIKDFKVWVFHKGKEKYHFSSSHVWMWETDRKKAEHWRIDAFELWCWRRLLRVPWTARRSNQYPLKEISPEYSWEGLMLKLKLQYFSDLMRKTDSLEKTLMLGKIKGGRRRGQQRMRWLDGTTNSMDMSLNKLWELWWTLCHNSIEDCKGKQNGSVFYSHILEELQGKRQGLKWEVSARCRERGRDGLGLVPSLGSVGLWRKLSAEELMLLNCAVGEYCWEFLGLQGDPTSPFWRRSALGFLWKEWC